MCVTHGNDGQRLLSEWLGARDASYATDEATCRVLEVYVNSLLIARGHVDRARAFIETSPLLDTASRSEMLTKLTPSVSASSSPTPKAKEVRPIPRSEARPPRSHATAWAELIAQHPWLGVVVRGYLAAWVTAIPVRYCLTLQNYILTLHLFKGPGALAADEERARCCSAHPSPHSSFPEVCTHV